MKKILRIIILVIAVLIIGFLVFFFGFAASFTEKTLNPIIPRPPYTVSEKAGALHERLFIADMHADSLLWNRDLNEDSPIAHVDLPKLLRGNVALQAFTVVTKSPRGLNI